MLELVELFRALGSERRFKVFLYLQANKEAAVCDVADLLNVSEPAACFHLKKLLRAGVIEQERDGKFVLSRSRQKVLIESLVSNRVSWKPMEMNLGNLAIEPFGDRLELLAQPVREALGQLSGTDVVGVTEIDPDVSDTAAFCERYGTRPDQAANCIVLEAKRGDRKWFAACVILAHTQANVNSVVRRTLDARRTSFAPMDQAVSLTGMEYGAITPVGLPEDWVVLVDKRVVDTPFIILGSGLRRSKLAIPGSFLTSLPNVQVVEGLAKERE